MITDILLSFVIPAYNAADTIEKAVQSLTDIPRTEILIVEKTNDGKPFELHTSYDDKEKYYRNLRNPWLFLLLLFALFAIIKHSIVLGIFSLVSAIPSILYQLQIINVRQKAKTWEQ